MKDFDTTTFVVVMLGDKKKKGLHTKPFGENKTKPFWKQKQKPFWETKTKAFWEK